MRAKTPWADVECHAARISGPVLPVSLSTSACSTGFAVGRRGLAQRFRCRCEQHRPVIPFLVGAPAGNSGEVWSQGQQPYQDHNRQRNTRHDNDHFQRRHQVRVAGPPPASASPGSESERLAVCGLSSRPGVSCASSVAAVSEIGGQRRPARRRTRLLVACGGPGRPGVGQPATPLPATWPRNSRVTMDRDGAHFVDRSISTRPTGCEPDGPCTTGCAGTGVVLRSSRNRIVGCGARRGVRGRGLLPSPSWTSLPGPDPETGGCVDGEVEASLGVPAGVGVVNGVGGCSGADHRVYLGG